MEYAPLEWVDWFNNRRLLKLIGNVPPAKAEANFHAAPEQPALATQLRSTGFRKTRRGSQCVRSDAGVEGPQRGRGAPRSSAFPYF